MLPEDCCDDRSEIFSTLTVRLVSVPQCSQAWIITSRSVVGSTDFGLLDSQVDVARGREFPSTPLMRGMCAPAESGKLEAYCWIIVGQTPPARARLLGRLLDNVCASLRDFNLGCALASTRFRKKTSAPSKNHWPICDLERYRGRGTHFPRL
jgi:hypothetical protein